VVQLVEQTTLKLPKYESLQKLSTPRYGWKRSKFLLQS